MSRSITIRKKEGEVQNKEYIYSRLKAIFSLLKNGEHELIVKNLVKKRSTNQNAMMWLWYACLSRETGSESEDFHDYYCSKFLVRYPTIEGIERKVVGGTRGLDTIAMTDFLSKIQADASVEFGVVLPTPDSEYWIEFEQQYKNRY